MNITFIIGGARSGKSYFALKEAAKTAGQKAYIAPAEAIDDEMKSRIEKHKTERGSEWDTYEEPVNISDLLNVLQNKYSAVLLDCLTIWLSNVLLRAEAGGSGQKKPEASMEEFISCLNELESSNGLNLFLVANEVGTGIVPENALARRFRDLAGTLNQKIAEIADAVYLVIAGIPIKIK